MIAAIRVRGNVNVSRDIEDTMKLLRLHKVNHLVLLGETKSVVKMLKKAENYITWGIIKKETLAKVLEKRALLPGNKKPGAEFFKGIGVNSWMDLAEKLVSNKVDIRKIGIKPVFRLRPPRKGFERKGIKKPFTIGGALGDRGEKINGLIERMI